MGLTTLVGRANAILSRYDGILEGIINPQILLSPLMMKEAEWSSRIEGTIATANEVYEKQAGADFEPEKRADIEEILNYRHTMRIAEASIKESQISLHMMRAMHSTLMTGVRGQGKNPGKFRTTQNWIGPKGCSIKEATYVPPSPLRLQDHLDQFERWIQQDDGSIDPIVKAALLHAQFEMIHPFDDGNGRIGRLLIPLYLTQIKNLVSPSLYISAYFERNREEYTHRLAQVSQKGDWRGWIVFFLEAVVHQANANLELVRRIRDLYEEMKVRVSEATHSLQAIRIIDTLFDKPIFKASALHEELNINRPLAAKYIRALKDQEILFELRPARGRRSAILCFEALQDIVG